MKKTKKKRSFSFLTAFFKSDALRNVKSSLICILIGVLFGFILMLALDPEKAIAGLGALFTSGFKSTDNINQFITAAIPMMLAGLSISFSFKLGLFNIGITGQVALGAFCAILCGLSGANWFVCLLVGGLAGALGGLIVGILKAKFNVNEVLSGIMLNWIFYYIIGMCGNIAVPGAFKDRLTKDYLSALPVTARMPSLGFESLPNVSWGLIIAIIIIIIVQIVLNRTTFGFELKMSGTNKEAAKYAGVNQTKSIILALTISGFVAGIAGYMIFATPNDPRKFLWSSNGNSLLSDGFNGISVSLIAQNSPIGCILSSMLLTYIDTATPDLKTVSDLYNIHYCELIKSIIIYVAALSSFISLMLKKLDYKIVESFNRPQKINKEGK